MNCKSGNRSSRWQRTRCGDVDLGDSSLVTATLLIGLEHDTDAEMLHDAEIGAAGAAPIGFAAGMALAALAVPGIAVGGLLALAGVGAAWGAFIGAYIGFGVSDPASTEHSVIEETEMTELQPGRVLVVACSHGHADAVRETMQRHDGRIREFGPSHT